MSVKSNSYLIQRIFSVIDKDHDRSINFKEFLLYFNTLMNGNEGCSWLVRDRYGVVGCGIEKAYYDGVISWKKPISCHLYPIRITKYKHYDAVNYERWHVCKAACKNGKALKVPVYKFLKEALIRKYGEDFYKALELTVQHKEKWFLF